MDTTEAPAEDPFAAMDPEMAANPQPLFHMLRQELAVLDLDESKAVLRRSDVEEVLRHP